MLLTWKKKRGQIGPDAAPAPSTSADVKKKTRANRAWRGSRPQRSTRKKKKKNEGKSGLARLPLPPALLLTATHKKKRHEKLRMFSPLHQLHSWPGADVAADAVDADADARVVTCLPRYPETSCFRGVPRGTQKAHQNHAKPCNTMQNQAKTCHAKIKQCEKSCKTSC